MALLKNFRSCTYKCKVLSFICLLFLLIPGCDNPSTGLKGKKMPVFTKNGPGYVHDNIQASVDMFLELAEKEQFTVDVADNSAVFATPALQPYDVIISSNTNKDVFDSRWVGE